MLADNEGRQLPLMLSHKLSKPAGKNVLELVPWTAIRTHLSITRAYVNRLPGPLRVSLNSIVRQYAYIQGERPKAYLRTEEKSSRSKEKSQSTHLHRILTVWMRVNLEACHR